MSLTCWVVNFVAVAVSENETKQILWMIYIAVAINHKWYYSRDEWN